MKTVLVFCRELPGTTPEQPAARRMHCRPKPSAHPTSCTISQWSCTGRIPPSSTVNPPWRSWSAPPRRPGNRDRRLSSRHWRRPTRLSSCRCWECSRAERRCLPRSEARAIIIIFVAEIKAVGVEGMRRHRPLPVATLERFRSECEID